MDLKNKLKLIEKLYNDKKDYNYFFNPFYRSKKNNLNNLEKEWNNLYIKDKNHLTHFYVHTPFCLEKCNFCQYHSGFNIENKETLEQYLNYLEKYILRFSKILKGKNFGGLYFGGGTASIYSEKQLERLLKVITGNINFNGEYFKEFELHPVTTTFKKLEILRKYGIDRITFGVQSFNKKTLDLENRLYVSPKRFKELIDYSKKLGFKQINADLIVGLNTETKEDILKTLKSMIYCAPYTINLYTLQSNKETSSLYNGEDDYYKNINIIHNFLKDKLIINSDYNYICDNINTGAELIYKGSTKCLLKKYDTHVNSIESIFGIGFGAYSHIFGMGKYYIPDKIYDIDKILFKYEKLSEEDEYNIFLARFIQEGFIEYNFFKENYNIDFLKKYEEVINFLVDSSKIKIVNKNIIFITDNIKETYIYGLLFLDLKFILQHSLFIDKNFKK